MRVRLKVLFLFLILLSWVGIAEAKTYITTEVNKSELFLEEELALKVVIIQENTQSSMPAARSNFETPHIDGLTLFSQNSTQNISMINDKIRIILQYEYFYKPRQEGQFTIPAIDYPYIEDEKQKVARTKPIIITVKQSGNELGQGLGSLILIVVSIVVMGILLFLFFRTGKKSYSPIKVTENKVSEPSSPYENQLNELNGMLDTQYEDKAVISQVQQILKFYISKEYQVDCSSKTTSEIETLFSEQQLNAEQHLKVLNCLRECDNLKFQPPGENMQSLIELVKQLEKILNNHSHTVNY